MVNYRYIGKGITDSNGIAHLTEDADGQTVTGYTGTGAGELDIVASTDKPISDGSLVSETYEVLDCIFYDIGTTGTPNSHWLNYGNMQVSSDETGTLVSKSNTGNGYYVANQNSISDYSVNVPFCCEFEIVSVSNVRFQVLHNGQNITLNDGDVVKFTIKDGYYTLTKNGIDSTPVSVSETTEQLRFQMIGVSSVRYKNFKVYPI